MAKEVVKAAFGSSVRQLYNHSKEMMHFDSGMVIKIDAKIPGRKTDPDNIIADRLQLAAGKLRQKNSVDWGIDTKDVYLAMTSSAYKTLLNDILNNQNYASFADFENGIITHFVGFKIIVTEYLPGGIKQPFIRDENGQKTSKP
ncbi:hypothetical protein [Candidatus Liberibacter sp.]|uniref:hypothetical protein n=1 Tax=Candidatus Liberibacter sp. TaxID=34022 RepID=UPI001811840E|nr:hypothetical protein [Candidatus Liberibacter sp.]MBA5724346.1 hypothetical protein [Candidatus Liberibacter sp.]